MIDENFEETRTLKTRVYDDLDQTVDGLVSSGHNNSKSSGKNNMTSKFFCSKHGGELSLSSVIIHSFKVIFIKSFEQNYHSNILIWIANVNKYVIFKSTPDCT